VNTLPRNLDDLVEYSVYYPLVKNKDALESTNYTFAEGDLVYYKAQVDGSFVESETGEFLKATVTRDGQLTEVYVHYTQVFQPTDSARSEFGVMTMVYGIVYQNANYQLARMNDFLNRATELNGHMRVLIGLYQSLMVMQSNIAAGDDNLTAVKPEVLQAFMDAGIDPPQSSVMVGLIPPMYFIATEIGHDFLVGDRNSHLRYEIFYKNGETLVSSGEIEDENNSAAFKNTEEGKASMLGVFTPVANAHGNYQITEQDAVIAYGAEKGKGKDYTLDLGALGTGRITAWKLKAVVDDDGKVTWKPEEVATIYKNNTSVGIDTVTFDVKGDYTPILESTENVIAEGKSFFVNSKDVENYCDVIRLSNETFSNKLSTVTTMMGSLNSDMQQNFTTATNILAKLEDATHTTTANLRT
jgi:hypothetical protein